MTINELVEEKNWKVTEAKEHGLELQDPDGWYEAVAKCDGCVHYTKYSNEPLSEEESNQDYLHICDIQNEIDRLYSLLQVARKHYKNHHYYDKAWEKEPESIRTAFRMGEEAGIEKALKAGEEVYKNNPDSVCKQGNWEVLDAIESLSQLQDN